MDVSLINIEVAGVALRVRKYGSGRPLLYLHGVDGLGECMGWLQELGGDFEVYAPEHPGFGDTPCPDWMDDISDLAYFYLEVMQKLALRDLSVIAHSLGGWIALETAVRDCSRMRRLALLAPAGVHVKGSAKADIFMIDPEEQARMSYADAALGEAAARRAGAEKYTDEAIANRIAAARFCWNPRFHNPRLPRWLHRVDVPALIIWGEKDRIFAPQHGPALQELISGSELHVEPDCGHLPHVEARSRITPLLRSFLSTQADNTSDAKGT